jgi:hypothetical protein
MESLLFKLLLHLVEKASSEILDLILDAAILRKAKERNTSRKLIVQQMLEKENGEDEDYIKFHRNLRGIK